MLSRRWALHSSTCNLGVLLLLCASLTCELDVLAQGEAQGESELSKSQKKKQKKKAAAERKKACEDADDGTSNSAGAQSRGRTGKVRA